MSTTQPPRDPAVDAILSRLDVPEHRPDFWADLLNDLSLEEVNTGAELIPIDRRRRRSRLVLVAVAAVLAMLGGYSLTRAASGENSIAPAEPTKSDPAVETTYAHLSDEDAEWAFSDQVVWADDRFVALTGDGEGYWTSPDGIDWNRHDGVNDSASRGIFLPWADCAIGFSCAAQLPAVPLPLVNETMTTKAGAIAGDRLLFRAWTSYGVFGGETDGVQRSIQDLSPDLRALAAADDSCFASLNDDPGAGTVTGGLVGETGDWSINLHCWRDGQERSTTVLVQLADYMSPDEAERIANPQNEAKLFVVARGGSPEPVNRQGDTGIIGSSGDRFWTVVDGELRTSADGRSWSMANRPRPDMPVSWFDALPGGWVALIIGDSEPTARTEALATVSDDGGATWSTPVAVDADTRPSAVGPAGLAVEVRPQTGSVEGRLIDDGGVTTLFEQPENSFGSVLTVGEDRVLAVLRGPDGEPSYEVIDAQGNLLHVASPRIPSRWQEARPFAAILAAAGAAAVLAGWSRRRRQGGRR